jgi:hypothetical protein
MNKISYSGISTFCNCRRAYCYRYIDNIEPIHVSDALSFGKAWHAVLAGMYIAKKTGYGAHMMLAHEKILQLKAMLEGYKKLYNYDTEGTYGILGIELPFEIMIRPPHKGRAARGIRFRGFIDLVIERDDGIWIMEHKTTSSIDGKYIDKLWHDLQIMLYAYAYQEMTGKKVKGIIYNIVQKSRLKQVKGESVEEFNARYTELCAKSKTGKSNAKRKMPETDDEFQERLIKQYSNADMFHREEILCDERRLKEVQSELWNIQKEMKSNNYYKNRAQCFVYNECPYFKICNSGENPIIIQNHYKEREEK